MNRREMLIGAGAVIAAILTNSAFAMKQGKDSKMGHDYGKKFEILSVIQIFTLQTDRPTA